MVINRSEGPDSIQYSVLSRAQCHLLWSIDRSEVIESQYVRTEGGLVLRACHIDVTGWHPEEAESIVARLEAAATNGGHVFGAWLGNVLVGVASIDSDPVDRAGITLKLDMLYVDRQHRNMGIGKNLVRVAIEHARSRRAQWLYISATPTQGTVDAYLRMGAVLNKSPDEKLVSLEPDDIHLLLRVSQKGTNATI